MAMKDNRELDELLFSSRDPAKVNAAFARARELCHLVTPMGACPTLPEGFEVSTSIVLVDPARETYDARPKREKDEAATTRHGSSNANEPRALGKPALDRISMAAAVSWDPVQTRRLDDGSHPLYCMFQAVGQIRLFDGTVAVLPIGTREMDLRQGSSQTEGLSIARLGEMRKRIQALTETMARLRVLRSLGLWSSYTLAELQKPFIVARLSFTGRTDDVELRRMFARMNAESALGATRALYGAPEPRALPAPMPVEFRAPPPVGSVRDDEERYAQRPAAKPVAGPRPDLAPRVAPRESAQRSEPARGAPRTERRATGLAIPGGKERGTPIEKATDGALVYWIERISRSLNEGGALKPEDDEILVDGMIAEQAARRRAAAENPPNADPLGAKGAPY